MVGSRRACRFPLVLVCSAGMPHGYTLPIRLSADSRLEEPKRLAKRWNYELVL